MDIEARTVHRNSLQCAQPIVGVVLVGCLIGANLAAPHECRGQSQPATSRAHSNDSERSEVDAESALSRFREAGGVAQWVDRDHTHLLLGRFSKRDRRVPLSQLEVLPQVNTLTLHGPGFTNDDMEVVARWSHLKRLHVVYNDDVDDEGVRYVRQLSKLERLHLWDARLTDAGMKHVASLPKLRFLEISNSAIGDDGLAHLKGNQNLGEVRLWGTNVSAEAAEKLEKSLPACKVYAVD